MAKIGDLAGSWKCPYCGTNDIWGYEFECPGCGVCRPKGIRFYLRPNAPKLTAEQVELMGSNPNWYCEHCRSGNPSTEQNCWQCGAEQGSSPTHRKTDYRSGPVPSSAEEAEAMAQHQDPFESRSEPATSPPTSKPISKQPESNQSVFRTLSDRISEILPTGGNLELLKLSAIGVTVLAAITLLSVLIYQFFFNTHIEQVQVESFHWTQNVRVEEYQVVHESSWGTHPGAAYNITSDYRDTGRDEKIHDGYHTESYQDTCYETESYSDTCTRSVYVSDTCSGTEDNGDGSFSTYTYECGGYESESYSCTSTRQVPYSCTKERQVEDYHYEDVYDWFYQYDVNRWQTIDNYPTSGSDHSPYYFTDFSLIHPYSGSGIPEIGQQQYFQIPGEYTVTFFCYGNTKVGDEGYFTRNHPLGEWEKFRYEVDYPVEVNFFNAVLTYPTP